MPRTGQNRGCGPAKRQAGLKQQQAKPDNRGQRGQEDILEECFIDRRPKWFDF